jgi:hypothetical protein
MGSIIFCNTGLLNQFIRRIRTLMVSKENNTPIISKSLSQLQVNYIGSDSD